MAWKLSQIVPGSQQPDISDRLLVLSRKPEKPLFLCVFTIDKIEIRLNTCIRGGFQTGAPHKFSSSPELTSMHTFASQITTVIACNTSVYIN